MLLLRLPKPLTAFAMSIAAMFNCIFGDVQVGLCFKALCMAHGDAVPMELIKRTSHFSLTLLFFLDLHLYSMCLLQCKEKSVY